MAGFQLRVYRGLSEPAEIIALCQPVTRMGRSKHCEIEVLISTCPLELLQIQVSDGKIFITKPAELDSHLFRGWCQVSADSFELNLGESLKIGAGATAIDFIIEKGRETGEVLCIPIHVRPGEKDPPQKGSGTNIISSGNEIVPKTEGFTQFQKKLLLLFGVLILLVWIYVLSQVFGGHT